MPGTTIIIHSTTTLNGTFPLSTVVGSFTFAIVLIAVSLWMGNKMATR